MITQTNTNKEYHANGQLAYIENISIVSEASKSLYSARTHPDGHHWIRTGTNAKYFDNGQLAWQLEYDNLGNLIKSAYKQYRKDGTVIE
jgi:antitoxin component YwqK of YwqJK toxin-antitoxin module